ncbi:MAG: hypothetical protein ACYS8I_00650 [Planctomycetota bacterium]|jgi:hypothetical protein
MIQFDNDDEGYFRWIEEHPDGFVLNVRRNPDPSYIVLHSASCGHISSAKRAAGAYTERSYRKWCSRSVDELREAAILEGRGDGSFSRYCSSCF